MAIPRTVAQEKPEAKHALSIRDVNRVSKIKGKTMTKAVLLIIQR